MANPAISEIINDALFDDDLMGETIIYNGVELLAIVQIGESEKQDSPAFMRQRNATLVMGNGFVTVPLSAVPNPKKRDVIQYSGKTYYVAGIDLVDSVGGNVTVKVTAAERGYFNKQ